MSAEFQSSFPSHKTWFNASALLSYHDPRQSVFYNHYLSLKSCTQTPSVSYYLTYLMPEPVSSFSPLQSILHISGIRFPNRDSHPSLKMTSGVPSSTGKKTKLLSIAVFQSPSLPAPIQGLGLVSELWACCSLVRRLFSLHWQPFFLAFKNALSLSIFLLKSSLTILKNQL